MGLQASCQMASSLIRTLNYFLKILKKLQTNDMKMLENYKKRFKIQILYESSITDVKYVKCVIQ
jgi:hypothetical protein